MGNSSVFGIYSRSDLVEDAVEEMKREGFHRSDIAILFPGVGTEDLDLEPDNRGLEGASAGAACGAVLGSGLGWLVGTGAVTIPTLDPYLGDGPILALLSGALISVTLGGIVGGMTGIGISAYRSVLSRREKKEGKVLLSVRCDDVEWTRRASDVLKRTGGRDIVGSPDAEGEFARTGRAIIRRT